MVETRDQRANLITVAGRETGNTFLLVNISPPDNDPEEIWSVVYENKPDELESIHVVHSWLTALRATPDGRLLAVSMDGELLSSGPRGWTTRDLECEDGINDLWVVDNALAAVAGERGERVLLRSRRSDKTEDKTQRCLNCVRGTAPDRIFAVGDHGVIWYYDGRTWAEQQSPTNQALFAVLLRADGAVLVGGANGVVFELGRQAWRELKAPDTVTIYGLAEFAGMTYAACGENGLWMLQQAELVNIKNYVVYDVQAVGGKLYAVGGTLLVEFDGREWSSNDLDL